MIIGGLILFVFIIVAFGMDSNTSATNPLNMAFI
jgi:hypothetical protein